MALTKEDIRNAFPATVYNYKVEVDGQSVGFSEVSGLNLPLETTAIAEAPSGELAQRFKHVQKPTALTLKKGMVPTSGAAPFFRWITSIQGNLVDKKDIHVRLCDEQGNAVISWKVSDAFPTKVDAPSFTSSAGDLLVERMEVMADRVEIKTD